MSVLECILGCIPVNFSGEKLFNSIILKPHECTLWQNYIVVVPQSPRIMGIVVWTFKAWLPLLPAISLFVFDPFPPTLLSILQNLVMFLSLVVAWVIPDVPKTIVEQLKQEKKLLVDVFLREEKEKFQLIQSLFSKDATLQRGSHVLFPGQAPTIPGRYSTLPTGPTQQGLAGDRGGEGPRARCRAASFSQFTRKIPPSPKSENENSRQTAVWHVNYTCVGVPQLGLGTGEHVARVIWSVNVSACVFLCPSMCDAVVLWLQKKNTASFLN